MRCAYANNIKPGSDRGRAQGDGKGSFKNLPVGLVCIWIALSSGASALSRYGFVINIVVFYCACAALLISSVISVAFYSRQMSDLSRPHPSQPPNPTMGNMMWHRILWFVIGRIHYRWWKVWRRVQDSTLHRVCFRVIVLSSCIDKNATLQVPSFVFVKIKLMATVKTFHSTNHILSTLQTGSSI